MKIPAVPSPSPSVIASKAPTPLANAQPSEYEYPLTMTFDKVPYSFKCNEGEEESAKESDYYACAQSYTIDKRNDPYKMVSNCNSGSCRTPCPNSLRSSSNETNVYHSEDKKYWYKVRVVAEEEKKKKISIESNVFDNIVCEAEYVYKRDSGNGGAIALAISGAIFAIIVVAAVVAVSSQERCDPRNIREAR